MGMTKRTPFTPADVIRRYGAAPPDENGCVLWSGATGRNGYGKANLRGQTVGAHRIAYEYHHGPIPDGMVVRHTCDVKRCIARDHLLAGTQADNIADKVDRDRVAHGVAIHCAIMTPERVIRLRADYATGRYSQRQLAATYGISQPTVSQIIRRKTWMHDTAN